MLLWVTSAEVRIRDAYDTRAWIAKHSSCQVLASQSISPSCSRRGAKRYYAICLFERGELGDPVEI